MDSQRGSLLVFADMTKDTPYIELSGWKVAYFRVLGWEKGEERDLIDPNKAPVLEICLVPEDTNVDEFENDWQGNKGTAFRIPAGAQIIRVRSGDMWPKLQNELKAIRGEMPDDWFETEIAKTQSLPKSKKCICKGFYKPLHCPIHGRN